MGLFDELQVTNNVKQAKKEIRNFLRNKGYTCRGSVELIKDGRVFDRITIFAQNEKRTIAIEIDDGKVSKKSFFKLGFAHADYKAILLINSKGKKRVYKGVTIVPLKQRPNLF